VILRQKVKVEVLDINDNAPVIELATGGIQLYESAELNTELHVGTARDLDSPRHGIDSCHLENTPDVDSAGMKSFFSLVVRQRLDNVHAVDLYLRLVSVLDREVDGDFLVSMRMSAPPQTYETGGARGRGTCPHPLPQIREKYFWGNYYVKFGHFSGKNRVKFGNFVNFSGKYHKKFGYLIIFRAKIM